MRVFRDLNNLPAFKNAVLTTGSFDGVHAGHQRILRRIESLAQQHNGESVVITFDPHPRQVIYPKDNTLRLLTSTAEKLKYLEQYGVQNAIVLPFTIEFSQQPAREYVESFLMGRFNPACLVVGYDHRFGLNREGNFDLLKEYADRGEFDLVQIDAQEVSEITVSSTKIRNAISEASIATANTLLGHPYLITGEVFHGEKIGQTIGFPTANVKVDNPVKLLPPDGIYAARVHSSFGTHGGMLYIGNRPTVSGVSPSRRIEVNLIDFDDDLYGKTIEIEIIEFIRHDEELPDLDALKEAITSDKNKIQEVLNTRQDNPNNGNLTAVVALNYNGSQIIDDFLPSVVEHTNSAHVVFADNASTDNSIEKVTAEYPSVGIIEMNENRGFAGGYNQALKDLEFKYFALINTDIEVTANWLQPLIDHLENNPETGVVQPKILSFRHRDSFEYAGAAGGWIDRLGYPFCRGRILNTVEKDNGQYDDEADIFWASGAAFVIRADLFKALGGFDSSYFAHMEEIDLCWRIRRAGYKIKYIPQSTVYHLGGATLTYHSPRKVFLNFRNNIKTLTKNKKTSSLLMLLPLRFVLDILAACHFLVQGQFSGALAVIRAYFSIIGSIPAQRQTNRLHRSNIENVRIGPEDLTGIYRGSILMQYYLKGRHKFSDLKQS